MPQAVTLANGVRALVIPVPHARSVSISAYLAAGSRYECAEDAGLSHFVEHLCFKGTERRPRPQDIATAIDNVGGSINAATERELTVYYAKVTPEYTALTLDVLVDMLRNSTYRPDEIERERNVILEELAAAEDAPDEQASLQLDRLLWPEQAHGRDIAGSPETVGAISAERLIAYYRRQYVANACVVSIAGAIDGTETRSLIEQAVDGWAPGTPSDWFRHQQQPIGARTALLAKETEQAHLAIGLRSLPADHPDRFALGLLSIILGEGMSSRLFIRLREELGLCYDVHTFTSHLRDTGAFGVNAGMDPANAEQSLAEIATELRRARQPVSSEELRRAQGIARSRIQLRMEDTRSVSGWYGGRAILDMPLDDPETIIARYEAVTVDDVQRVAHEFLRDGELHLSVVGPFADSAALDAALRIGV